MRKGRTQLRDAMLSKNNKLYSIILFNTIVSFTILTRFFPIYIVFLLMIPLIWSHYYVLVFIFSYLNLKKALANSIHLTSKAEKIAILMTICDDFNLNAANSLLYQNYPDYSVFILDDSRVEENSFAVQNWCSKNNNANYTRRKNRKGYKAGNLNHAIKVISSMYKLFVVVDSDEHLPSGFLQKIFSLYYLNNKPSFVQGIHVGKEENVSDFSKNLAPTIYTEWKYHILYKNKYGQTGILGHGYLIEREVLEKVNGHPEIVSEDLALTMVLATSGYKGIMDHLAMSQEIYPESVESIERRRFRYIVADWEILKTKYFKNFLLSSASLREKCDLFLREIRLPISSIYFSFAVIISIITAISHNIFSFSGWDFDGNYLLIGTFYALIFSPFYPLLDTSQHSIFRNIRACLSNLFLSFSYPSLHVSGFLYFLKEGKATFWVTNERIKHQPQIIGIQKQVLINITDVLFVFILTTYCYIHYDVIPLAFSFAIFMRLFLSNFYVVFFEKYCWVIGLVILMLLAYQTFFIGEMSILSLLFLAGLPFLIV